MTTFDGAVVRIGGDITGLQQTLAQVPSQVSAAMAAVNESMSKASSTMSSSWVDANGRMHDATGKFVSAASISVGQISDTWVDASGRMRDATGKFVAGAGAGFEEISTKLTKIDFDTLSDKLTKVGTTLSVAITTPIAVAGAAIVKFGGDFDSSMTRVAVLSDASAQELAKMREQAIKLGVDTPYSAKQAADAMGEFAASGFKANEVMSAMPGILGLAASGQVSTAQAAQVTSDILRGYSIEASQASMVSDVLAKAAADSSAGVADLGNAFKYIGPVASMVGVSFHETAAALEILADAGIRGEKAGTGLQQMLQDLLNPSKKASEAMAHLGVTITDVHGNLLPLPDLIDQFTKAKENLGNKSQFAADMAKIFGARVSDVIPLINAGGDALRAKTTALENSTGAAKSMGDMLMGNLKGSMDQFKGSVETLAIVLFDSFGPSIRKAIDFGTELVNKGIEMSKSFKDQPPLVKDLEVALLSLAAAAGPAILGLAGTLKGLSSLGFSTLTVETNALAAALRVSMVAVAAFIGAWAAWESYKDLKDNFRELSQNISGLGEAFNAQAWSKFFSDALAPAKEFFGSVQTGTDQWRQLAYAFGASAEDMNRADGVIKTITDTIGSFLQGVKDTVSKLRDDFPQVLRDSVTPVGWFNTAILNANRGLEDLLATLDIKTAKLKDMDKAVATSAETLQSKLHASMVKAGEAAGSLKTSVQYFHQEVESGHPKITTHKEKLSEAEKEHIKLQKAIEATKDEAERLFTRFAEAAFDFHSFREFVAEGGNVKTAVSQIDAELLKIKQKFADGPGGLPPDIRTTVVGMTAMKNSLIDMKREFDQFTADEKVRQLTAAVARAATEIETKLTPAMKVFLASVQEPTLDEQFHKLNGELSKIKPNILEIPPATKEVLDGIQGLGNKVKDTAPWWKEYADIAKNSLYELSGVITKSIITAITGSEREEMAKQKAELDRSLAEKTAAWEQYQQDAIEKLENIRAAAEEKLRNQIGDLRDKLHEKEAEYDKFVQNVEGKISEVTEQHRKALEKEVGELRSRLDDKITEYERYKSDVIKNIEEVKQKHSEALAKELDTLRRSNEDKVRSYQEYAANVSQTIERLRQNLAEKIADETERTRRSIEDRQRDYDRYAADIQKKIADELAKGKNANMAQVADWQLSLSRRAQDLGIFIDRAQADLANFTARAKREEEQKEKDLQESLKKREEEMKRALEENARKMEEATRKHKEEADKQVADLQENLRRRTEDFDKFKNDTAKKIEEITLKHQQQLDAEVAKLRQSVDDKGRELDRYKTETEKKIADLEAAHAKSMTQQTNDFNKAMADQKAEYERFKQEYERKLQELDEKHKGVWENLKTVALNFFGDIINKGINELGEAIWKLIKEGGALKALEGAFESIVKKVGGWFGGLFDGIGKGINGIGGAPIPDGLPGGINIPGTGTTGTGGLGGLGGAASSAGSGISGAISAVTGLATAAASIVQAFQLHGIGQDTGKMEENTRATKEQLIALQGSANTYWPWLENLKELQRLTLIEEILVDAHNTQWLFIKDIRDELVSIKNVSLAAMINGINSVSTNTLAIFDNLFPAIASLRIAPPEGGGGDLEVPEIPTDGLGGPLDLADLLSGGLNGDGMTSNRIDHLEINITAGEIEDPNVITEMIINNIMDAMALT